MLVSDWLLWLNSYNTTTAASAASLADSGLGLGLAVLVLFCETRSCNTRRHNDLEGHSNFLTTIYSFPVLCLEHLYCGDQQWRSLP